MLQAPGELGFAATAHRARTANTDLRGQQAAQSHDVEIRSLPVREGRSFWVV